MPASLTHIRHQGPMLAALGRTAFEALRQRVGHPSAQGPIPGPELTETVPARSRSLIDAYLRAVGGHPSAYLGRVPPHLFPQWAFPLIAQTLIGIPYPPLSVLNGGCRLEVRGPISDTEPLTTRARLEGIDDDGRRAVIHQTLVTGSASHPEALRVDFYPIIVLRGARRSKAERPKASEDPREARRERLARTRVPEEVRELTRWRLTPRDALDFALLTGDLNPIHWIKPAARAAGFKNVILHGFASMSRAAEAMIDTLWGGDPDALRVLDVRFTRPLVLPHEVGLYIDDAQGVYVGDGPGGPAYLRGAYEGGPHK